MPITAIDKLGIIQRDKNYDTLNSISTPNWVKSSIIYEVYLRAFSKDGTISAFTKKLMELKELGVDVIWLMPVHSIGHFKRKGPLGCPYAIRDFYRINTELGTMDDFKTLVTEAHQLGLRIMMDLVANHAAYDHVEIKNHPDWFKQDRSGNFTRQVPGWSDVIDINYESKEVWKYMKEMMLFWVKNYDIDGYRCDVAGLVPENFWIQARNEILEAKSEFVLLAEWEDPEMHLKSFDITYDWMIYYKLYDVYRGLASAQEAIELVIEQEKKFPKHALRLRFLENHDQARASYKFGVSSFKPFAAFIFTIAGIPLIYNGQEVGDTKYLSLFDKNSINWKIKGAYEVRQFYKTLVQIRKSSPVFTEGEIIKIENTKPKQVVSYFRKMDQQLAVVVLNFSDQECTVNLKQEINHPNWRIIQLSNMQQIETTIDKWRFKLKPYDGQIFIAT